MSSFTQGNISAPKTPQRVAAPRPGRKTDGEMAGFYSWLSANEFKPDGGFIPHLVKIVGGTDVGGYSRKDFQKEPKAGMKLVRDPAHLLAVPWWLTFCDSCNPVQQQIFEKLWLEYLRSLPEEAADDAQDELVLSVRALDLSEVGEENRPLEINSLSSSSPLIPEPATTTTELAPLPPFTTAFTPCPTVLRACTWNVQQLKFVFDDQQLDSVAAHLSTNHDLLFLQEIPPGDYGQYRLRQLVRAMNSGCVPDQPRFKYLLGHETVVLDTTSQLNAIIYPAHWTLLRHESLTEFLHPPVMAWFNTHEPGRSTVVCASLHVSPSVGLASAASASSEAGIPATPSKASSSANKATLHARLQLQLGRIVETAQSWEVSVPTTLDKKEDSPRFVIGGDYNLVPDSLPHGLVYCTPRGMPTAIASRKTLDGFIFDPLTAGTHNPVVRLRRADRRLSDHHLVSLELEEY